MKCPKCHKDINEDSTVCPYCHKVLALVCPNCHSLGNSSVCEECGYIILEKCAKCGKIVSTEQNKCKCGFPVNKSVEINECETDEFASVIVKFNALKKIRRLLSSKSLYAKFINKLRNVLKSVIKNTEGTVIKYANTYVINFNKELSFPTSSSKAVKLALKIINAYTSINQNVIEELSSDLGLCITIIKKNAADLLQNIELDSNVKLLQSENKSPRYLKGMQIVVDQFVQDNIANEYSTDSLYSVDKDSQTTMFYEIILNKYILPPNKKSEVYEQENEIQDLRKINKNKKYSMENGFKVFDINASCKFISIKSTELSNKLDSNKIISICSDNDCEILSSDIVSVFENNGKNVIRVVCDDASSFKTWGVFDQMVREYWKLSNVNSLIDNLPDMKGFSALKSLIYEQPIKSASSEDARFTYMEEFCKFLSILKNYVIIIEGFSCIDDSTIQTLSLYFDNYKNIIPQFVFVTDKEHLVHSKIKNLLRTDLYTEFTITPVSMDDAVSCIKEDATDFINSFYYEKIEDNFDGSKLYFDNAIKLLLEKDVLVSFDNKLLIKNNSSVLLMPDLKNLIKTRLKHLSKVNQQASMILAAASYLGSRLDPKTLMLLGIENVQENLLYLEKLGFGYIRNNIFYVNNYQILKEAVFLSMKNEAKMFLCKTIFVKLGKYIDSTQILFIIKILSMYKEEYLILWKNAQYAISVGDYDSYLKNCFGFLSLTEYMKDYISPEDIETSKKDIFLNILISLYAYSPEKIYSIEEILLLDALKENDDEKIVKLSNLMLQGALISSNYAEALNLLHNILTRMPHPELIVDNMVNSRFLLLSLVHIEILFNIGDYSQAIEISDDILAVLNKDIIEAIKPQGFSTNLFVNHLLDTFRLTAFAKLIILDDDIDNYFEKIKIALDVELPDKNAIIAIREFLEGRDFVPSNIEDATAFSKVVYLLLHEFKEHKNDYKSFAQNIYQAKLLSSDINQKQLELICDALIAYSYANVDLKEKALNIYTDILEKSEKSAIFNVVVIVKYLIALLHISNNDINASLEIINDALALMQKYQNQTKIFYAMFEKLLIEMVIKNNIENIDVEREYQNLMSIVPPERLPLILANFVENDNSEPESA